MALSPWQTNVPIVDPKTGRMTRQFEDWLQELYRSVTDVALGVNQRIIAVTGTPEGNPDAVASPGSIALRSDGGVGTSVYKKETGTGNIGWVAL